MSKTYNIEFDVTSALVVFRVLIGVRDKKRKTLTLHPACGDQVVRLRPRLSNVEYDIKPPEGDLSDYAKRVKRNTQLVRAFGSTRRYVSSNHSDVQVRMCHTTTSSSS